MAHLQPKKHHDTNSYNSDLNIELPDIELLNKLAHTENPAQNNRAAARCLRDDILAYISHKNLFRSENTIAVRLVDINSRGVLIATTEELAVNKKISIILNFRDGKQFIIPAKIVRHQASTTNEYGIKFDRCNNELGDYLLATQSKLIFK